jgi:hypothetical protein
MIDDRLQIDGFNPYVWSGTFGVTNDGFPKTWFIDGSYTTQIDETPMTYTEPVQGADDPNKNGSGSMYLKTTEPDPAPFMAYPARKLEYSDGTVTWFRPGAKWPWIGQSGGGSDGYTVKMMQGKQQSQQILFWLAMIALVAFLFTRLRRS